MKSRYAVALLAVSLGVNALASAATVKGTVTNLTRRMPAAGVEVALLSLAFGMTEIGRVETDASGGFRFTVPENAARRLVRVVHQGVAYHTMAPHAGNPVNVEVYDAAPKLNGVAANRHVQRYVTEGDTLRVTEMIEVRNASDPPRTLMNDRPFEIQLPASAKLESAMVQIGNGQVVQGTLAPADQKGRYYFPSPLRPGVTRFAVAYRLPYAGAALIEPKILYPVTQFAVVLPDAMLFQETIAGTFRAMSGPKFSNVRVAADVRPDQPLQFRISGVRAVENPLSASQRTSVDGTALPAGRQRALAGAPESPHTDRWFFLGGLAVILAAGVAGAVRAHKHNRELPQRLLTSRNGNRTHGTERETAGFAPQPKAT